MMNKRILSLVIVSILFSSLWAASVCASDEPVVEFYYGIGCSHCAKVEPFIEKLEEKYPDVTFEKYEAWHNEENAERLFEKYNEFNVSLYDRGVPIVFVDDTYIIGDTPIINGLEIEIDELIASGNRETRDENDSDSTTPYALTIGVVIGAAFVDSINPCAIAVLVILLTALLATKDWKRALRGGLAFTLSIYISYLLFGIGLSYTLQVSGLSQWLYTVIGIIAILIGLANLKDFFWYGGGGFVMEIPRRWRPRLQKLLHGVTTPLGAFLVGFVVTLFELPCTGGPYIFVIGLLSHGSAMSTIIPILLFYNLIFVLPLIVLTILISKGMSSTERIGAWKERNIRLLHLIGGIIMIALGIWVIIQ